MTHRFQLRVRYAECDPMGVAHHSSYAPWMEMGRTELLRETGRTYEALEREGVFLVITKLEVRYRRPVRYDDVVEIRTTVEGGSRVKIRHIYEMVLIERAGAAPDPSDPATPVDGICAVGSTELACVGADGRPRSLPEWLIPGD
ncbi:MAG: thioesterase family protein [Planctomycetota bacterium]